MMKQFNYNALDEKGKEHSGFIEARDKNIVLQQLRQRGLYVLQLDEEEISQDKPKIKKEVLDEIVAILPVKTSHKVFFFKQLALMIRSGMSITEAFDIISNMQKGYMKQITKEVNWKIKSGDSFSKALSGYDGVFSKMSVQMIRSAETSGELDVALIRIAKYMEHKAELKKQVLGAMMYPVFTLLSAIGVFMFLVIYIIPKFKGFLLNSGKSVPPATQLMLDVGNFFTSYWSALLTVLIAAVISFTVIYKTPKGKYIVDHSLLFIPIIGGTLISASMAQLSWGMSMLLKSGIPVVESLRIITDMIGNSVIAKNVSDASDQVLHGQDLATSFKQSFISELIHQLMVVGERSGNLVQMMEEASIYYEDDLQSKTKTLASLVEPVSILLIGGIVGFVYYGFFQALLSVSTGG